MSICTTVGSTASATASTCVGPSATATGGAWMGCSSTIAGAVASWLASSAITVAPAASKPPISEATSATTTVLGPCDVASLCSRPSVAPRGISGYADVWRGGGGGTVPDTPAGAAAAGSV